MTQYLNPRNDIAFRKIFGDSKNKDILIHFLNDVLNKDNPDKIIDVTLINPTQLPEIDGSKESILDVLCTDNRNVQYIVEMQVSGRKGFAKRAQYYAAKAYSSQAKQSDLYHDLKGVVFLAILDFVMLPDKPHYKCDHIILDKQHHTHDLKDFYFTFIELPKFNKTNPAELINYEEKWCYFFKHAGELDNMRNFLNSIEDNSQIIHKAYRALEAHNWTEDELRMYERMEKINKDTLAREAFLVDEALARGEARGIEIGKTQGIEQAKLEIAQTMKQTGMSNEQIALLTQLPLDIINQLN